jgi:hypothetical protein
MVEAKSKRRILNRNKLSPINQKETTMKTLTTIAKEINDAAEKYQMGKVQEIRRQIHGRVKDHRIFTPQTIHENWACHSGGRTELQFNIGFEGNEWQWFRYGVAFSLEASHTLPKPLILKPKILKLNDFLCKNAAEFEDLRFWFYRDERSATLPIGPIPAEVIKEGTFLFWGKLCPREAAEPHAVVLVFDRLLDAYRYVEGSQTTNRTKSIALPRSEMKSATHKLTRISYNSGNWQRPTGDARKHETSGTYNHKYGFGHEDWLFRLEWQIDGWRYAFLEGINKSHRRLLAENEPVDLTLFTIQPDKKRRFVARIKDVECLNDQQAKSALKVFKEKGWFKTMQEEIKAVGGNAGALGNSPEAKHILNVRFRLGNVIPCKPNDFVRPDDPVMRLGRYQLYDLVELDRKPATASLRHRKGAKSAPAMRKYLRRATAAVECTPEHAQMQAKLLAELKREFPAADIVLEKDFIDVCVRTKTELILYEIKSDLDPRVVIRQALGQILEYAFHPQRAQKLPVRLIIVGRCPLSSTEQLYLETLRRKFSLPLEYRIVSI